MVRRIPDGPQDRTKSRAHMLRVITRIPREVAQTAAGDVPTSRHLMLDDIVGFIARRIFSESGPDISKSYRPT